MALHITKQAEIDKYFASDAINQSKLKLLQSGMRNFLANKDRQLDKSKKRYLLIGAAVDTILTGENGEYEKQYYVFNSPKISDIEKSITQEVFDLNNVYGPPEKDLISYEDSILEVLERTDYYNNRKIETRLKTILEKCSDYFTALQKSFGKDIITEEEDILISRIVMSLKTNERTAKYFDRETQNRNKNIDVYYQLPIYFDFSSGDKVFEEEKRDEKIPKTKCKALLDLVIIEKINDKFEKIIVIDLKTTSGGNIIIS